MKTFFKNILIFIFGLIILFSFLNISGDFSTNDTTKATDEATKLEENIDNRVTVVDGALNIEEGKSEGTFLGDATNKVAVTFTNGVASILGFISDVFKSILG